MTEEAEFERLRAELRAKILKKMEWPSVVDVRLSGKDLPDWLREPRRAEVDVNLNGTSMRVSASWTVAKSGFYYPDTAHISDPKTGRHVADIDFSLNRPDCEANEELRFSAYIGIR